MITAEQIVELAAKLRVAQRRATYPAEYSHRGDAETAAVYAGQIDEALEQWHKQQEQPT